MINPEPTSAKEWADWFIKFYTDNEDFITAVASNDTVHIIVTSEFRDCIFHTYIGGAPYKYGPFSTIYTVRNQKKYVMLFERFEYPAGTIVYKQRGYDYGLANDDMRASGGVEHMSVTLKRNGGYPGFTIPKNHLKEIQ